MSLFSSLNLARLSLAAHQSALQTVGQNIANATTEGYARQRVHMTPTPANDLIFARIGTGVRIDRIERVVDEHLESTLRDARSDLGALSEQNRLFSGVESIFGDLNGGGLTQSIARFFESLEDLANTPENMTARQLVLEEGETLVESFHYLDERVRDLRKALDDDVSGAVRDLNTFLSEIAELNQQIVIAEDGGVNPDTANDLRTRRDFVLGEVSDLVQIKIIENDRGSVQVISGSEVLVYGNRARELAITEASDGNITLSEVSFTDDGKKFQPLSGRLGALIDARDGTTVSLGNDLNTMATGFIQEFNALHAGGEGLERLTFVRSEFPVTDRGASLTSTGLPFAVQDGRFTFQVVNEADGTRESYLVPLEIGGAGPDSTLTSLVGHVNTVIAADHPEISASITADGYLEIRSSSDSLTFTFREDETGFLQAAGINTFFTGTTAGNIDVSDMLRNDPRLVTTGRGTGPGDDSAINDMLALRDAEVVGPNGQSFEGYYTSVLGRIGVDGAEVRELMGNQERILEAARNQREALSGVNIDEEAIEIIKYQRAYQGSARFLTVVDNLLDTLINSV